MGRIPAEIIDQVRIASDIVSLVSEYVRLTKKGRNFVGNCPFHQERDPSFTVSPDKQIFYCFGCHAGGNVFKFLMLAENIDFQDAVRRLADRAGIRIPPTGDPAAARRAAEEERVWKINQLAAAYYHRQLLEAPGAQEARRYLQERGLSEQTVQTFQLGYAPAAWDGLLKYLQSQQVEPAEAVRAGLLVASERGGYYDRFRHRIIFPIHDQAGHVVGFGGRVLDDSQPKYLNTPETSFFNKGRLLYGLHLARRSIQQLNQAVLVEGYMDVIAAHQAGATSAVATLGTALTERQGKLLLRYTDTVYIAYDADNAGQQATWRGLDVLQSLGLNLYVVELPDGKDPDEYFRRHSLADWQQLLRRSRSLLEYKINILNKNNSAARALQEILPGLAAITSPARQEEGVRLVAAALGLSWETVREELKRYAALPEKKEPETDKIVKNKHNIIKDSKIVPAWQRAEQYLLRLLIEHPQYLPVVQSRLGDAFWQEPLHREIYQVCCAAWQQGGRVDLPARLDSLAPEAARIAARLLLEDVPVPDGQRLLDDCLAVIQKNLDRQKKNMLISAIQAAEKNGDWVTVHQYIKQLQSLQ
ncbi:MAG: DNA primase [Desulfurispora sp.]|uniref:DNA primase n=1 Tax=Desulfurispora sp. TaxID=3014275 RepID=UPI00404B11A8